MLPTRLSVVAAHCCRHPVEALIRQWNYKAAITSATVRSLLFLVANATAGWPAALAAAATEFAYRAATAGFHGALTQHLGRVEPARVGWLAAMVCLPLLGHGGEMFVHWTRGTPNLGVSLAASMSLTALSTSFNLFAMRRGVLVVGVPGRQSLWSDLQMLPAVALAFVRMVFAGALRLAATATRAVAAVVARMATAALLVASVAVPTIAVLTPSPWAAKLAAFEDPPLTAYRAVRRIEVDNPRFKTAAWADVLTELTPGRGLEWRVLREGGSAMVRRRAIVKLLDGEVAAVRNGDPRRARIGDDNYLFGAAVAGDDGAVEVAVTPKRQEPLLLAGTIRLTPDGDLVEIRGLLAKSPSAWTRKTHVTRRYARLAGVRVPTEMVATAEMRLLGTSTLRMQYAYESVNGLPIATTSVHDGRP